jgi:hypothetical protein
VQAQLLLVAQAVEILRNRHMMVAQAVHPFLLAGMASTVQTLAAEPAALLEDMVQQVLQVLTALTVQTVGQSMATPVCIPLQQVQ